jgi:hypothetical protein
MVALGKRRTARRPPALTLVLVGFGPAVTGPSPGVVSNSLPPPETMPQVFPHNEETALGVAKGAHCTGLDAPGVQDAKSGKGKCNRVTDRAPLKCPSLARTVKTAGVSG